MLACLGAAVGIGLTALVCKVVLGPNTAGLPFIVAPMGASAVLLFAVPSSPLAQPWSVVGGNTISVLVGILVARLVHDPVIASGLAVGLAIAAMSFARCLHPPGGAAALTAVIGGKAVLAAGFMFAFFPVAVNSILLTLLGVAFHRLSRRAYPHVAPSAPVNAHATADPLPQARVGFQQADVDAALKDLGEAFDIDRKDLDRLLRQVEMRALARTHAHLVCADIMSRDVVSVGKLDSVDTAHALLLSHDLRTLPVVDADGRLLGVVGLREFVRPGDFVAAVMKPAVTAAPETPAFTLIGPLTDGRTHAVMIVDADQSVLGVVTQTDLLAALSSLSAAGSV